MASLQTDKNGHRRILFWDTDGRRKTIRLGKIPLRLAETIKVRVEDLIASRAANLSFSQETGTWLGGIGDTLREKLNRAGLIEEGKPKTLADLLEVFQNQKGIKPATATARNHVVRDLPAVIPLNKPVCLITPEDGEKFRSYMLEKGLRPATVSRRLQTARQIFQYGVTLEWILRNPFRNIRHPVGNVAERQRYVSIEETERLLSAAPDVDWRAIIGLCRYAGLRCPSEVLSLRWEDVRLADCSFWVRSPKTEHLPGKEGRWCPIFAPLVPILEESFERAKVGQTHVIPEGRYLPGSQGKNGWTSCNLRSQFHRIILRAGLQPWPRSFQNLRSSCESDLARRFPIHLVTQWIGNTPRIAQRHYLQVTLGDFQAAAGSNPFSPEGTKGLGEHLDNGSKSDSVVAPKATP